MGMSSRGGWRLSVMPLLCLALLLGMDTPGSRPPQGRSASARWGLGAPSTAGTASARAMGYVEGEILLRFKEHVRPEQARSVRAGFGDVVLRRFHNGAEHLKLGKGRTVEEAVAWLNRHPLVEYAEPNYLIHGKAVPNDLLFGQQYGLDNTGLDGGVIGADIHAVEAWETTTGSQDVLVAVIDSGIDVHHPDLAANIWVNPNELPGNGLDDDGNGYIDDVRGWDFVEDKPFPQDPFGHGTHVSGIIGAVGNNGAGIAGVSWKISLVNVRFLNSAGSGSTSDAIAAIEYATGLGVDIINASWGGTEESQGLYDAITFAGENDILFVAAAGNENTNLDFSPRYPAAWDHDNLISVAATDHWDQRWSFYSTGSNYGAETVDLGAPGYGILSTVPMELYGVDYLRATGTSMAAPHVSGAAALLRSAIPGITAVGMKALLMESVDPLPTLATRTVSGGRLNISRALEEPDEVPPGAIGDVTIGEITTNTMELRWTATGDDGEEGTATSYDVRFATQPIDAQNFTASPRLATSSQLAQSGMADGVVVQGLDPETIYWFAVRARDEWGNAGSISNTASAETLAAPTLGFSPASITATLFLGQEQALGLSIRNIGAGTLDWQLPLPLLSHTTDETMLLPAAPNPGSGRVWAGKDQQTDIVLDARDVIPGLYAGNLVLLSNDPLIPEVLIPLEITVADAPIPAMDLQAVEFGQLFAGRSRGIELLVSNLGTAPLVVSEIQVTDPALSVAPDTLQIAAGESSVLQLLYRPTAAGLLAAQVILISNSPARPELALTVSGSAILPPQLVVETPDLEVDLFSGGTATLPLRLTNTGDTNLIVSLALAPAPAGMEPILQWDGLAKGEEQTPDPGAQLKTPLNRSDRYGYTFADSGMPGGPQFDWVEISEQGQPVDLSADDALSAPIPLGFDFPFYGQIHDSVRICSNGWLSFSSDLAAWSNPVGLPARGAAAPENLIAPFFDDLGLDNDQRIFILADGTRFVVQYSQVRRYGAEEEFSFQVILEPDGRILFQYLSLPAFSASATVGIQDADGGDGLLVAANDDYLRATMAVELEPPPVIYNGSFETGSFSGWRRNSTGVAGYLDWKVRQAGDGLYLNLAPVDGLFNAQNDFDGLAGHQYELWQDIKIPTDIVRAELSYYDRIQYEDFRNRGYNFLPMTQPKIYEASIRDLSGNVLEVITHQEIFTKDTPYTDLGLQRRSIELSPYAGETIRVHIRQSGLDKNTGPVSMEYDAFRVEVERAPGWVRLPETEAVIPAGSTQTFDVPFSAGPRETGVFKSGLRIASNDPWQTEVILPVIMNVTGAADITLLGEAVAFTSEECYQGSGASTVHDFVLDQEPAGNMILELTGLGSGFRSSSYYTATLLAEGRQLGSVSGYSYDTNSTPTLAFPVSPVDMADIGSDGVVHTVVQNSSLVSGSYSCPDNVRFNGHRVGLSYDTVLSELAFGQLFIGESRELPLQILDAGTEPLVITGLASAQPAFTAVTLAFWQPARWVRRRSGSLPARQARFRPISSSPATIPMKPHCFCLSPAPAWNHPFHS